MLDGSRLVRYLSLRDVTHVLALRGLDRAGAPAAPGPAPRALRRAA